MSGCYANEEEEADLLRTYVQNNFSEMLPKVDLDELLQGRFGTETYSCDVRTISQVIDEHQIQCIDLLKVDVEKSELDVLLGIREEHWPRIRQVVVEVHDHGDRLTTVTSLLSDHGFRVNARQEPALRNSAIYTVYAVEQTPNSSLRSETRAKPAAAKQETEDHLRLVILGGDALDPRAIRRWVARNRHRVQLFNMYGITETTVHVTHQEILDRHCRASEFQSPIGRPLQDLQVFVLDGDLQLLPIGVTGELCVSGAGLARGYLNRPGLTAARFVPHPFATTPGERLYRTGNLAQFSSDGTLEYLGRADRQVKVRAHRIELGEIETVLRQHVAVKEALAIVRTVDVNDQRLVAYVTLRQGSRFSRSQLATYLKGRMPAYMIPSAIIEIDAIPLGPNGKVEIEKLPSEPSTSHALDAPRPGVEEEIMQIWRRVLRVDAISRHANFFDSGGHSLLLPLLLKDMRELNSRITMVDLFEYPTIETLAGRVRGTTKRAPEWGSIDITVGRARQGKHNLVQQRALRKVSP